MPFNKWKAFSTGVIDSQGNQLVKRKDMNGIQKTSFGVFDLLVLKLKKLLGKLPGGTTKIASYAAALWLIKEWNCFTEDNMLTEDISELALDISLETFVEEYLSEDGEIANVVGSGNIAGLGVGPNGEPGLNKKQKNKYKLSNITDPNSKRKTFRAFMGETSQSGTLGNNIAGEPGDPGMSNLRNKTSRKNKSHPTPSIPLT